MSLIQLVGKTVFRLYIGVRLLYAYLADSAAFLALKDRSALRLEVSVSETYGKHKYVVPAGSNAKYHYVEKGQGPLIVFVHGFPQSWYTWKNQIAHFSDRYRCVAIDLKGCGDSDKPVELAEYESKQLVRELAGVIDAVRNGSEKVTLVGHDWGGILSWTFAEAHPEYLERLIVLNAPHMSAFRKNVATMPSSITRVAVRKLAYMSVFQIPWLGEIWVRCKDGQWIDNAYGVNKKVPDLKRPGEFRDGFFAAHDREVQKAAFFIPGVSRAALNYYSAGRWTSGTRGVPVRTLVIWGDDDAALDHRVCLPGTEEFFPNIEIHHIPGCSHWVPEQAFEEVNERMAHFLKT